ncbi:hypothetical protein SIN8267_02265 [Sinobacterium norvegicum]|uniref:HTH merR-type domain-containing protein n=1 Tax=Sinobacterium norvegicum TaxID=1641715 RepID=A0ABM9AG10_9GAMM|nr:MerR family transcriptional regulator [Sinobacterium norvegicum]CAH0992149.1 hypothetical protein SIN8267_02265 [Sinobacterium norvegicum]
MSEETAADRENVFPIRDLSAKTSVNTVTLRAWERRYGLLKPQRTSKGHRLYSEADVATVEKILSLVSRGVPLTKVKPLLSEQSSAEVMTGGNDWSASVDKLIATIGAFSASRIEPVIDEFFLNYPANVCREQLVEPAFERLTNLPSKASLLFAESELLRYTLFRLNFTVRNDQRPVICLMYGPNTPIWRLCLMAMELSDANYKVEIISQEVTLNDCLELTGQRTNVTTVFYQDGVWRKDEGEVASVAIAQNNQFFLCGTAAILAAVKGENPVFSDLNHCTSFLLKGVNS